MAAVVDSIYKSIIGKICLHGMPVMWRLGGGGGMKTYLNGNKVIVNQALCICHVTL